MARYKIVFKSSVAKELRSIPNNDVKKILQRIDELADNPRATDVSSYLAKKNTEYVKACTELSMKSEMKHWWSIL